MKIAFFEIHPDEEKELKKTFKSHQLIFSPEVLTAKNTQKAAEAEILSVYIYSKVTHEVLDQFPHLKCITTRSTGYDHIDREECKKRKITVCNVPSYGENTVAEHAFALILELSRRVTQARQEVLEKKRPVATLPCFDLKGKTFGVIGTGRIGQSAIHIAKGFGMNVIAYDIIENKQAAKEIGFTYVSLENLLKQSDVITLHVFLSEKTHHLLNKENLKHVKKGSILINTSRGPVVETAALVQALKKGDLSGAGLDVLEDEESLIEGHPNTEQSFLLKNSNVIYTPHTAFYSKESVLRILTTTIENITSFLSKKPLNTL